MNHLRNFTIIAHIDHGKSTLADRLLEATQTIEKRKMKDQVLDKMDLERERGITIKMQPVRMKYKEGGNEYILNLIDTPGHIDFSYEVSRALRAVEGSLLLVDSTQGVQAQTLTVLAMARDLGLTIIPVITKIDSPLSRVPETTLEVARLLSCDPASVMKVSGRTGEGVPELLARIVRDIPPPQEEIPDSGSGRGLIFDFEYSNHKGIVVFVRILDGKIEKGDKLVFVGAGKEFVALDVGVFQPEPVSTGILSPGETGYVVTGIKEAGFASVGDTITSPKKPLPALPGYAEPRPVVWASLYTEGQDEFPMLKAALERLRLSDPAFTFEEETSGVLGRGFRCGFLGMLHLEIISERVRREHNVDVVVASPSIVYQVTEKGGTRKTIYSPAEFPEHGMYEQAFESWILATIIAPASYLSAIMQMIHEHEAELLDTENFGGERIAVHITMPLRELMRNFFDGLKSASSGFASLSYEIAEMRPADVTRLDILIADEVITPLTRVVSRKRVEQEARSSVERLKEIVPRQQFVMKIQAQAMGRIIASETVSAFRKDVLTKGSKTVGGGDVTRKKKLLEKQKRGKARMKEMGHGRAHIPPDVFIKMISGADE